MNRSLKHFREVGLRLLFFYDIGGGKGDAMVVTRLVTLPPFALVELVTTGQELLSSAIAKYFAASF